MGLQDLMVLLAMHGEELTGKAFCKHKKAGGVLEEVKQLSMQTCRS